MVSDDASTCHMPQNGDGIEHVELRELNSWSEPLCFLIHAPVGSGV